MLDPWAILLTWAAIYGDGPIPEGLGQRPEVPLIVRQIALAEEWIGTGEVTPSLEDARHFCFTLKGTPRSWELDRFPPEEWLDSEIRFARAHIEWLEARRDLAWHGWERDRLDEWIEDSRRLIELYRAVSYAHWYRRQRGNWHLMRENLAGVRVTLGEVDWRAGRLPPVVPLWRFQRLP